MAPKTSAPPSPPPPVTMETPTAVDVDGCNAAAVAEAEGPNGVVDPTAAAVATLRQKDGNRSASGGAVLLKWKMPCSAATAWPPAHYRATFVRNDASGSPVVHPPLTLALASPSCCGGCSAVVHGLEPGAQYSVWLQGAAETAVGKELLSKASKPVISTCGCSPSPPPPSPPGAPGAAPPPAELPPAPIELAVVERTCSAFNISWRMPPNPGGAWHAVRSYVLAVTESDPTGPTGAGALSSHSDVVVANPACHPGACGFRVAGLRPGKMYAVSLTASSDVGEGPASRPLAVPMRSAAACAAEAAARGAASAE